MNGSPLRTMVKKWIGKDGGLPSSGLSAAGDSRIKLMIHQSWRGVLLPNAQRARPRFNDIMKGDPAAAFDQPKGHFKIAKNIGMLVRPIDKDKINQATIGQLVPSRQHFMGSAGQGEDMFFKTIPADIFVPNIV